MYTITVLNEQRKFTLEELAALVGLPRRTVRYYIQCGLIERPHGAGKGAYYTQRHLEHLLLLRRWQMAGLSLERIGELLRGADRVPPPAPRRAGTVEVWSHLVVAEGVELALEPGRAGLSPEQTRALFRAVTQAYAEVYENEVKS